MNIECNQQTLAELTSAFRFNDAVIRNLVVNRKDAVVDASPLAKPKESEDEQSSGRDNGDETDNDAVSAETTAAPVEAATEEAQ